MSSPCRQRRWPWARLYIARLPAILGYRGVAADSNSAASIRGFTPSVTLGDGGFFQDFFSSDWPKAVAQNLAAAAIAALEARSMITGALAFFVYASASCRLMAKSGSSALSISLMMLPPLVCVCRMLLTV